MFLSKIGMRFRDTYTTRVDERYINRCGKQLADLSLVNLINN